MDEGEVVAESADEGDFGAGEKFTLGAGGRDARRGCVPFFFDTAGELVDAAEVPSMLQCLFTKSILCST